MFVVTVTFELIDAHAAAFLTEMRANAAASVTEEAGCLQFDVCGDPQKPARCFLYEVYADAAAFDVHVRSAHFRAFDARTRGWVLSKVVHTYLRLHPA